jgi:hypothetical protein
MFATAAEFFNSLLELNTLKPRPDRELNCAPTVIFGKVGRGASIIKGPRKGRPFWMRFELRNVGPTGGRCGILVASDDFDVLCPIGILRRLINWHF